MMQNGVIRYEKRKRETYAFSAKCSTIKNPAETENGSFCVYAETRKSPVIWGFFVFHPLRFSLLASFQGAISPLSRQNSPDFLCADCHRFILRFAQCLQG